MRGLAAPLVLALILQPAPALASQWGSAYGDPPGFCAAQSFLPSTYTSLTTGDPLVGGNPEQDTFWVVHPYPGYTDWYGYWYGDFRGRPGDDSGWVPLMTVWYGGPAGHWNFGDFGWAVHGHAKQYIAYYNWTFGGQCGLGVEGSLYPPPYMADVYGWPVVDVYVDSVSPYPPQPRLTDLGQDSATFTWDPVADRGDGAGADYFAVGRVHYRSWLTVDGGPPLQYAATDQPRRLTAAGLRAGQAACLAVQALDGLENATPVQTTCARALQPPPAPPLPSPGQVQAAPVPGLVGLESWFWLRPPPAAFSVEETWQGTSYRITATPLAATWDFGDGAGLRLPAPDGFGRAYPQASTVGHTYQAHSGGYAVRASVRYALSWSALAGGHWLGPYPMGEHDSPAAELSYPVRQAQPELT